MKVAALVAAALLALTSMLAAIAPDLLPPGLALAETKQKTPKPKPKDPKTNPQTDFYKVELNNVFVSSARQKTGDTTAGGAGGSTGKVQGRK